MTSHGKNKSIKFVYTLKIDYLLRLLTLSDPELEEEDDDEEEEDDDLFLLPSSHRDFGGSTLIFLSRDLDLRSRSLDLFLSLCRSYFLFSSF